MSKSLFEDLEGGEALPRDVGEGMRRRPGHKRAWLDKELPVYKEQKPDPNVRRWLDKYWQLKDGEGEGIEAQLRSHVAIGQIQFATLLAMHGELPPGVDELQEAVALYGEDE